MRYRGKRGGGLLEMWGVFVRVRFCIALLVWEYGIANKSEQ